MSLLASPLEGAFDKHLNERSALVYLLKVAAEEGVLDSGTGPRTAVEIAASGGSDPGRIGVLCATLVTYGILTQDGDTFIVSDRFKTIMPAEAIPALPKLLDEEELRLRRLESPANGSVPSPIDGGPGGESFFRDLRPVDPVWNDTSFTPGALSKVDNLRELFGEPQRPASETEATERAGAGPRGDGVPAAAEEVWAKVKRPVVPTPVRHRYESPVTALSLGSAFARSFPIGPRLFDSVNFAARSVNQMGSAEIKKFRYRLGTMLWVFAAVCILWAAWDLWGTGLGQAAAQEDLKTDFAKALSAPATSEEPSVPSSVPGDAPAPVAFRDPVPAPLAGSGIALMKISTIDLEQVILEGTSVKDLKRGPGHYRGTPLPGKPGNVAIAGHRTTYGAPFFKLGRLRVGHEIKMTTKAGEFTYRVSRIYRVDPDDSSPLLPSNDNILTLTTCDPPFSAAKRLIVVALLVGEPDRTPAPTVAPESVPVPTTVPQPVEAVAPGLDLRAIKQPGASPSPKAPGAAASPSPSPSPSAKASPAAGAAQPVTAPPKGAPATTTTTAPPPIQTAPPQPQDNNPFLQPQPQDTVPPVQTAPTQQTQPSGPLYLGECSDGIDNDNDGKIDFDDRAGCHGDPYETE